MNPTSNFDSVRREQIAEGARMAREDGAIPRSPLRLASTRKPPAAPKGHEAFLKALEASGTEIEVEKVSGVFITGTVKHSDKYTITLRSVGSDGAVFNRVVFKHDISEFRALAPRPAQPEGKLQ